MQKFKAGDIINFRGKKVKVRSAWSDGDMRLEGMEGYYRMEQYEAWKEPEPVKVTALDKLGLFNLAKLKFKMKMPNGITLNDKEADYVIESWQEEASEVVVRQTQLAKSSNKIEKHLAITMQEVPEAMKAMKEAKRYFTQTKNVALQDKWARKLVVRTNYYEQLRNSHIALSATIERVKDAVDDAQYIHKTIQSRVAEANIYKELNGGMKLVGKSLLEARTKHELPTVEYSKLELTMEALEREVSSKDSEAIIAEAKLIAGDTTRWSSDDGIKTTTDKAKSKKRVKTNG